MSQESELGNNEETVVPTCRYGHGTLTAVKAQEGEYWGLVGAKIIRSKVGEAVAGSPLSTLQTSGRVYTVQPYLCTTCGYMELFDDLI